MADPPCVCLDLGPPLDSYDEAPIGVDETNGRHGDVSLRTCRRCGRTWLRYFVEYEGFSRSGRWFLGLLPEGEAGSVAPEAAVSVLEQLPWHVYGGSYFDTPGRRGIGRVKVDL